MEKRSSYPRERELDEEQEIIEEEEPVVAPKTKRLRLMKDVRLKYVGRVTGNVYLFSGAGQELDIDERDADEMLAKRSNRGCCPGSGIGVQTPYFEEVR